MTDRQFNQFIELVVQILKKMQEPGRRHQHFRSSALLKKKVDGGRRPAIYDQYITTN
ncbi:MAG: hypothetical protein KHW94_08545 [Clostridium sp.]|nr:hypothetical protein [Clostridium sp.]